MPDLYGQPLVARASSPRRVGRLDQVAGVRLVTLGDGVERGVRVLEFRTGTGFEFDVVVDRAFDIGRCEHAGRALAWTSATGLRRPVVLRAGGPRLLPQLRRRPADHLRARPRAVHGRGHRRAVPLPAEADRDVRPARPRLEPPGAAGRLRRALGRRRVRAVRRGRGAPGGRLRRAAPPAPPCRGARRRVAARRSATRSSTSVTTGRRTCCSTTSTSAGRSSTRVGAARPRDGGRAARRPSRRGLRRDPGARGAATSSRSSSTSSPPRPTGACPSRSSTARLGLGAYEVFRRDQLPHHFVWRMLGEGTYVVGIEPCTNRTAGRLDARTRGELIELDAGREPLATSSSSARSSARPSSTRSPAAFGRSRTPDDDATDSAPGAIRETGVVRRRGGDRHEPRRTGRGRREGAGPCARAGHRSADRRALHHRQSRWTRDARARRARQPT